MLLVTIFRDYFIYWSENNCVDQIKVEDWAFIRILPSDLSERLRWNYKFGNKFCRRRSAWDKKNGNAFSQWLATTGRLGFFESLLDEATLYMTRLISCTTERILVTNLFATLLRLLSQLPHLYIFWSNILMKWRIRIQ